MSDDLPIVGRPRGSAWRQLQAEGILWEGQILVAGGDTDLACLLVVTNERLALIRGGAVALDIRHEWLYAPPTMRRTGNVGLQVLTPGQRLPESITIIVREGRLAAAELVDVLTPRERYEPEYPTWDSSMFLDDEPIIPARPAPYGRKHSPAPVDPLPSFPVYAALDDDDFPPIAPPPDPMPDWSGTPQLAAGAVDPAANVIPRQNDWNLKPLDGMDNRERRNRRAWAMRFAALFLAIAGIAAWQGGLLPEYSAIRDRFEDNTPEIQTVAELPPGTPTQEPTTEPRQTAVPEPTKTPVTEDDSDVASGPSSTQAEPTYSPAEQTAVALGVGGGETDPPGTDVNAAQDEPAATNAPVIAPPDATEAPATEPTTDPAGADEPAASENALPEDEATETPGDIIEPTQAPAENTGVLDFEITDLQMGASLPDLTLGPLQDERWVVVTVDVTNPGSSPAVLDMSQFKLARAEGEPLDLDSATGAVAAYLGMTENNGVNDTREIGPGDRTSVVLVFVPPADATGLALDAGEAELPLVAGSTGQSGAGTVAATTELSAQLLVNNFKQYSILTPTATQNAKTAPAFANPWEAE
ncbi:MAG: DUF4352 domain-containing protein [Thermomicrobiales bacterium]